VPRAADKRYDKASARMGGGVSEAVDPGYGKEEAKGNDEGFALL
jgi:hypothetical protein